MFGVIMQLYQLITRHTVFRTMYSEHDLHVSFVEPSDKRMPQFNVYMWISTFDTDVYQFIGYKEWLFIKIKVKILMCMTIIFIKLYFL